MLMSTVYNINLAKTKAAGAHFKPYKQPADKKS